MSEVGTAGLERSPVEAFDEARQALRAERRKLVDEQQAFEQFADRVGGLEPTRQPDRSPRSVPPRGRPGLERVHAAYRETVMSVPHYREDYDESLAENLAGECDEALAVAVADGTHLSPWLQRSLVAAAREAGRARGEVLETIDEERAALDRGAERVRELVAELVALREQPLERAEFNCLRETRERLDAMAERCETLTTARQETLRSYNRANPLDLEHFGHYCYGDCESIHPIISLVADVAEQVDRTRQVVDRRLTEVR